MPLKERLRVLGIQILDEDRSRDKGGVCKLRRSSRVSCGGYADGPGLTGAGEDLKAGLWGPPAGKVERGLGAGRGAAAAFALGKVSDPEPGSCAGNRKGPRLPWRRAGRGDSGSARSPAR